jgi:tetratricopeptide (TPR) repeat protein
MASEAYSPCPCGSGKKFKWCCQPIHVEIDKAFRQFEEGQHDASLRTMDEVTAAHPDNPEAWGRKAQLLYQLDRVDDAESALQKALDLNPNYPFGHFLRGEFRRQEGEIPGALLLFRKAAELYDPEARPYLARIYALIGDCELKLNNPVAARAALQKSMHYMPVGDEDQQAFEALFGKESRYPLSARREYTFQGPAAGASPERRAAWERTVSAASTGRLTDALRAFEQLTAEDGDDAPAWFNLGLVRAWLGDNVRAVEALDPYLTLETDDAKAAAAWALAEVLRCGQPMIDQADYVEYSTMFQMRNPQQVVQFLGNWEHDRRLLGVDYRPEEGILTALVLDRQGPALTAELEAARLPRLGANVRLLRDLLMLWGTNQEALGRVTDELRRGVGPALSEAHSAKAPAVFSDILSEALVFPVNQDDQAEVERRMREQIGRYFEDSWIHRPLRALNNVPPVDAAGHGTLRKKLLGVIQFLQECGTVTNFPYDFDRLRHKLGVGPAAAAPAAGGPAAAQPAADIGAMNAAELAGLAPAALGDEQMEQAYQAALRLDARDLAGRFARELVGRPPRPEHPDRYPWYTHLVQQALAEGDTESALNYLNEGEKADCEHNEGRRRNEYELRRGQVLAKRGDAAEAQDVFDRLIARVPADMRYRSGAAEAMLSARQGARALKFAEEGLARARQQNDRDSEDHFKELVAAARRAAGG